MGVVLAKVMGFDFVDTDLLIQRREGCRLEEIIREKGTESFLDIEGEVCGALEARQTVIATGGSVIYREEAMRHLKELGIVVYLKVSCEALSMRLSDMKERGVALKEGQTLRELYDERTALYERYADLTVDEGAMGLEETVKTVKKLI